MIFIDIKVPYEVRYISDWKEFGKQLPQGHVILNKNRTNCGASTYWLRNSKPTIIASPRVSFLQSKKDQHPSAHLFRPSDKKKDIGELKDDLEAYCKKWWNFKQQNPYNAEAPKILVTYDSFKYVSEKLQEMKILQDFDVLVDEMHCLFTDALYKGTEEIEFLEKVIQSKNVIFMSATPFVEEFLNEIEPFKSMKYVMLEWNLQQKPPVVMVQRMKSLQREMVKIITQYKTNGFFEQAVINGQLECTKEAVFFVNEVRAILAVCKSCNLKRHEVNILCSSSKTKDLKYTDRSGNEVRFDKGTIPLKGAQHKTYTFVTKASFEGVDFYSPCCSTYIFASPNRKTLSMDISIDLYQILGRQRLEENVFRRYVNLFFDVDNGINLTIYEARKNIEERIKKSKNVMDIFNQMPDEAKNSMQGKFRSAQELEKYKEDYVVVVESRQAGNFEAIMNYLVMAAEYWVLDIRGQQYCNEQHMLEELRKGGYDTIVSVPNNQVLTNFLLDFNKTPNFSERMKLYIDFINSYPESKEELLAIPSVPIKYPDYLRWLGSGCIGSCGYDEKRINACLDTKKIRKEVQHVFRIGEEYSTDDCKSMLGEIYQRLGIKRTAIGKDITKYAKVTNRRKKIDQTGKRVVLYKIESLKHINHILYLYH